MIAVSAELLAHDITELQLPVPITLALHQAGVVTVAHLTEQTLLTLIGIFGMRSGTLVLINEVLLSRGLSLTPTQFITHDKEETSHSMREREWYRRARSQLTTHRYLDRINPAPIFPEGELA